MLEKVYDIKEMAREICAKVGVKISPDGLRDFAAILQPVRLLRGKTPIQKGEVCQCIYYVKRGLVIQHYEKNGKEVVEQISHEGDIMVSIESYFKREPSRIEALMLEPGNLFGIPYDEMQRLSSESYEMCRLMMAVMEYLLIESQQTADLMRFETAKERYRRLLHTDPELIRRTPVHYVASLLQMKPETLSRMRTQVMKEEG